MKQDDFKKLMMFIFTIALLVLAFIVVKPILLAILFGIILAYLLRPAYLGLYKFLRSENLSALLIVLFTLSILLVPTFLLIPVVATQAIAVYNSMQAIDITAIVESLPILSNSLSNPADVVAITSSFTSNFASFLLRAFQAIIFNLPSILLQIVIVLFTFFFTLRDHDKMKNYFLSVSPFPRDSHKKFYEKFTQVTNSILYGQLIVGLVQGIVAGIGYKIFGVPNALLLTILTMLVGVIPIIGPWLVWMPIDIYLFASGQTSSGIGLLIYGLLIINWIDNLIRPFVVSKMAKMNSAIALIGMVGGLYVFGIMGLILGPLILAYLFLIAESYREKIKIKSIIIQEEKPNPPLPSIHNIVKKDK